MNDIDTIKQHSHGGDILAVARQLECHPSELSDLSSNLSPFGLIPGLTDELARHLEDIAFLPEIDNRGLLAAFERKYGLEPGQSLAGNGTTEFIFSLPEASGCKRALIVAPTYSDYRRACERSRIEAVHFHLDSRNDFILDLDRLRGEIKDQDLVFICNPNNPTGHMTGSRELHDFIVSMPNATFLVDESYLPFVREPSLITMALPDNLYILSSASKIYGMPGLRLGYLISTAKNLAAIAAESVSWSVNRLAQVAGLYILEHGDRYIQDTLDYLDRERALFVDSLNSLKQVSVVSGVANFLLCRLSGPIGASRLRQSMLSHRIIIRDCSNFENLDDHYFRVSLKDEATNRKFLRLLRTILE